MRKASFTPLQRMMMVLAGMVILAIFYRVNNLLETAHPQSALAMYVSGVLLKGGLLYKDVWFNGLPGILLADAVALKIKHSISAIVVFEILCLCVAAAALFETYKLNGAEIRSARFVAVWFCVTGLCLSAVGSANSESEWALPFLVGCALYLSKAVTSRRQLEAVIAGLMGGAACLFISREFIIIPVAVLALRRRCLSFILSFLIAPVLFIATLIVTGGMEQFKFSCVDYSYYHSVLSYPSLAFRGGTASLLKTMGLLLPAAVLMLGALSGLDKKQAEPGMPSAALKLWTALELVAVFFNGIVDPIEFLPVLVPATIYLAMKNDLGDGKKSVAAYLRERTMMTALLISFITIAIHAGKPSQGLWESGKMYDAKRVKLVTRIIQTTVRPNDTTLIWSASPIWYFLSGRESISRFPSIIPLFTKGYGGKVIPTFISEVERAKPETLVIVDSLLPEGLKTVFADDPNLTAGGDERKVLLNYLQERVKRDYEIYQVREGVVFFAKKRRLINSKEINR